MALITLRLELPAHFLDVRGQRAGFVLVAAFLGSFLFIRTSARLMRSPKVPWWPGSVTTGSGLHLHHLVWGIVLVLLAGFLEFATTPTSPWNEILAGTFGVGSGLPCVRVGSLPLAGKGTEIGQGLHAGLSLASAILG